MDTEMNAYFATYLEPILMALLKNIDQEASEAIVDGVGEFFRSLKAESDMRRMLLRLQIMELQDKRSVEKAADQKDETILHMDLGPAKFKSASEVRRSDFVGVSGGRFTNTDKDVQPHPDSIEGKNLQHQKDMDVLFVMRDKEGKVL